MFTNEQVNLVVSETLVSTHIVMATMFDFEAGNRKFTVADVIAAILVEGKDVPAEERARCWYKSRRQSDAERSQPE